MQNDGLTAALEVWSWLLAWTSGAPSDPSYNTATYSTITVHSLEKGQFLILLISAVFFLWLWTCICTVFVCVITYRLLIRGRAAVPHRLGVGVLPG